MTLKDLVEPHINVEKDEELKRTLSEIEDIRTRILKLIIDGDNKKASGQPQKDFKEKSEVIELVEEFHKRYRSLYALYDQLRGEIRRRIYDKKEKEAPFVSPTNSESETDYFSSDDMTNTEDLQKVTQSFRQELENANLQIAKLKQKLTSAGEEKEAMNLELQEAEKVIKDLKLEAEAAQEQQIKLIDDCSKLQEKLTSAGEEKEALNLELQEAEKVIKDLKLEAEAAQEQQIKLMDDCSRLQEKMGQTEMITQAYVRINELEAQIGGQLSEITQLQKENQALHALNSGLETSLKQQGIELSALTKNSESKIEDLMEEVENLRKKIESLSTQKGELEAQIARENESSLEKVQSEPECPNEEIVRYQKKINSLKNKLASKNEDQKEMLEEKDGLQARVKDLELEVSSLCSQKIELEEELSARNDSVDRLKEERDALQGRISELDRNQLNDLERMVEEKEGLEALAKDLELKLSSFCSQKAGLEEEICSRSHDIDQLKEERKVLMGRISEMERNQMNNLEKMAEESEGLKVRVKDLELELISLCDQKSELEQIIRIKNQEVDQLDEEKKDLLDKISEQETIIAERSNQLMSLEKKAEALTTQIGNLKLELESLQTPRCLQTPRNPFDSLRADQEKALKEKDDLITKLKEEYKQNARHLFQQSKSTLQIAERKMEEMSEEIRKNSEDNLRILSRRILIAEQLHAETNEGYRRTKDECEQQHGSLDEMLQKLYIISETTKDAASGLNSMFSKFEQDSQNYSLRISDLTTELQLVKTWIEGRNKEAEQLKKQVDNLAQQLQDMSEKESSLKDAFSQLENKLRKEEGEKSYQIKCVGQLEKKVGDLENIVKEKQEGMVSLGEEKKEAIRQLCMGIDYQRSRCLHFREVISKMKAEVRTPIP